MMVAVDIDMVKCLTVTTVNGNLFLYIVLKTNEYYETMQTTFRTLIIDCGGFHCYIHVYIFK